MVQHTPTAEERREQRREKSRQIYQNYLQTQSAFRWPITITAAGLVILLSGDFLSGRMYGWTSVVFVLALLSAFISLWQAWSYHSRHKSK